jgi:hypothetical protein
MRGAKCVPLWLDAEMYRRLEQVGQAEERGPEQQARWLLRQALEADQPQPASPQQPVGVGGPDAVAGKS